MAAQLIVGPDRQVHSLHGYFMRSGDITVPIVYQVDRIRDGSTFTTRRVVAIQYCHAIFSLEASFQIDEVELEYQMPLDVRLLEELKRSTSFCRKLPMSPSRASCSVPKSGRSNYSLSMSSII